MPACKTRVKELAARSMRFGSCELPSPRAYGTIYVAYSCLATALQIADTINPTIPDFSGIAIYDLAPVSRQLAPDVGTFTNAKIGLPGVNNPATGLPG